MSSLLPKYNCSRTVTLLHLLYLVMYITIAGSVTGCSGITSAVTAPQQAEQEGEKNVLWREHKSWLISKLPKAEHLTQEILSALRGYSAKSACFPDDANAGCDDMIDFLAKKMSPYKIQPLPEGMGRGRFAIINGDTAYVFRITDLSFSGIADVPNALYFSVASAPFRRADGRSFAFVADEESDATSTWSLYRRSITDNSSITPPAGEFPLTRAELDSAGIPKQVDLLTPQQRSERDLAKQGLTWQRRTQTEASRMCSKTSDHAAAKKGGGKRKHNYSGGSESSAPTQATPPATLAEALQGKANLNCKTGIGYVATPDGVVGEVYRLIKDKEGADAIIATTAKEIPGGVIRYRYPVGQENFNSLLSGSSGDMLLQLETAKGDIKLDINLRANNGVANGSLLLPGEWYRNPGYHIGGKDLSNGEFAALFIRAFRDCAMKDGQGNCKNIPDLFMSFINSDNAADFVKYLSTHYLSDTVVPGQ